MENGIGFVPWLTYSMEFGIGIIIAWYIPGNVEGGNRLEWGPCNVAWGSVLCWNISWSLGPAYHGVFTMI